MAENERPEPGPEDDFEPLHEADYEGTPSSLLGGKLDAILKIAAAGEENAEGEEPDSGTAPEDAEVPLDAGLVSTPRGRAGAGWHANDDIAGGAGVVALLGALKADIDALRRENELFKARLMGGSERSRVSVTADDSHDLRQLLAILQADIEALRHENDFIRSQAFAIQSGTKAVQSAESDLHAMLVELRADIQSLKKENDALRREHSIGFAYGGGSEEVARLFAELKHDIHALKHENDALRREHAIGHAGSNAGDDVSRLFSELKNDINALKHENEALRLENLAARDGARMGLGDGGYRSDGRGLGGAMRTLATLALVAVAAGGGYYLALSRQPQVSQQTAAIEATRAPATDLMPAATPAIVPAPVVSPATEPRPVSAPQSANEPVKGADAADLGDKVETVMLARADQLVRGRDLGAARMVLVYLARKGSAAATRKLAESYDPARLAELNLDAAGADVDRARRLYTAAVRMGDATASQRLEAMGN